jgi:hypothetical protein
MRTKISATGKNEIMRTINHYVNQQQEAEERREKREERNNPATAVAIAFILVLRWEVLRVEQSISAINSSTSIPAL